MNNILAAKVLISHLPEITDDAYKTATEIAIENLFLDAINDWHKSDTELSAIEYLGLTEEQYVYWLLGKHGREEVFPVNIETELDKEPELDGELDNRSRKRFTAPTVEEVSAYCRERGNSVDPQHFVAHYEANGWRVGKNPMKDWKAAVRNWSRSDSQRQGVAAKGNKFNNFKGRDIDYDDLERRLLGG